VEEGEEEGRCRRVAAGRGFWQSAACPSASLHGERVYRCRCRLGGAWALPGGGPFGHPPCVRAAWSSKTSEDARTSLPHRLAADLWPHQGPRAREVIVRTSPSSTPWALAWHWRMTNLFLPCLRHLVFFVCVAFVYCCELLQK